MPILSSRTELTSLNLTDISYVSQTPHGAANDGFFSFATLLNFIQRYSSADMTGDITLDDVQPFNQFLNPNGGDRIVDLSNAGWYRIVNNSDGTNSITVRQTATTLTTLSASANVKAVEVLYIGAPLNDWYVQELGGF